MYPMRLALDTAFIKIYGSNSRVNARIKAFHSYMPHPDAKNNQDVMQQYGSNFLYVALIFNFVVQLNLIVAEKEAFLRSSMAQMGMMDSSYWSSWLIV